MIANVDEAGIALVLLGAAALVFATALLVLVWRRGFQSAEASFDTRFGQFDLTLAAVRRELNPNSGSSLVDKVTTLLVNQTAIVEQVTVTAAQVAETAEAVKAGAVALQSVRDELSDVRTEVATVRTDLSAVVARVEALEQKEHAA